MGDGKTSRLNQRAGYTSDLWQLLFQLNLQAAQSRWQPGFCPRPINTLADFRLFQCDRFGTSKLFSTALSNHRMIISDVPLCCSGQTRWSHSSHYLVMETQSAPRVTCVDRFRRGVVITFEDGKSALYSSDLLRQTFPQAEELKETAELNLAPSGQP